MALWVPLPPWLLLMVRLFSWSSLTCRRAEVTGWVQQIHAAGGSGIGGGRGTCLSRMCLQHHMCLAAEIAALAHGCQRTAAMHELARLCCTGQANTRETFITAAVCCLAVWCICLVPVVGLL